MVPASTRTSLLRCALAAAFISGLSASAGALVAADENQREAERLAKDEATTTSANRFKLLVFMRVPQKEGTANDQKPIISTIVTANKAFEFNVKQGLGASGILREDNEGRLHFKGQVNMSPGIGFFDQAVEVGQGSSNRGGLWSGGFASFFVLFDQVNDDAADVADLEPLILEARAGMNVTLQVMVSAGVDFRTVSTVKGRKWSLTGTVHKVDNDAAIVSAVLDYSNAGYRSAHEVTETEFKIDDLGNSWGAGSSADITVHLWIRRGVDPAPALKSMLARRDDMFWHAAWYATELGGPQAREAIVPDLIDALNDGIDRSGKKPFAATRVIAARTLGKFGAMAKPAVPTLVERLEDDNGYVRIAAAVALWKIKRQAAAVPALIAELENDAWPIRHNAVGGLGEIASKKNAASIVPALIMSLEHDQHAGVRHCAVGSLSKFGAQAESAVPALTRALNDGEADIPQAARRAIDVIVGH